MNQSNIQTSKMGQIFKKKINFSFFKNLNFTHAAQMMMIEQKLNSTKSPLFK